MRQRWRKKIISVAEHTGKDLGQFRENTANTVLGKGMPCRFGKAITMAEIQVQRDVINPMRLSEMLQQEFPPTEQQAAVIGAPMESLLVVAGAGAGKTATMAARVVGW